MFSLITSCLMLMVSSQLFAISPAEMAVFQSGPVGYGQAYMKRQRATTEGHFSTTTRSGREDSSLTDLGGDSKDQHINGAGQLQLSEAFYLLFAAQLHNYSRNYKTDNSNYEFNSNGVNYTVETGAHIEKGGINYGSKIGLRIFGGESRKIFDPTVRITMKIPETQLPFLKFWSSIKGENSQLGIFIQLHNKSSVKPKSDSSALGVDRQFGKSVPGLMNIDLRMKHSESVTFAFGLQLIKKKQASESIQDTSNVLTGSDRYQSIDKDQYKLLVGSELLIRPGMTLYSSLIHSFDAFAKEEYASIITDNIGGTQLASSLMIGTDESIYGLGLTYRLAKTAKSTVGSDSSNKPWAGGGNKVIAGQTLWRMNLSWKLAI